jgi:hypothetical protein
MATIHVMFDPQNHTFADLETFERRGGKSARLSIPNDLGGVDIYNVARKLAELLLEQIEK